MSFDLGVWHSETAPTVQEASEMYVSLCEQKFVPTESFPAVEAFYQELCLSYPEIDTLPEERLEDCPWSCAHDKSGFHVIIAMRYGETLIAVAQYVADLAAEHGLICYDPQGPNVYLPPALKPKRLWYQFWKHD